MNSIDASDSVAMLEYLFLSESFLLCPNAADFNSDGRFDIADPVSLLGHLFLGQTHELQKDVICR